MSVECMGHIGASRLRENTPYPPASDCERKYPRLQARKAHIVADAPTDAKGAHQNDKRRPSIESDVARITAAAIANRYG
ncbi:hypothetical protein AA23498_2791 [Acetobacter nitrogenifigens DSM 23921 = NBRC 105050]|uniref:Uncharacterized protein n=1 Tax=Acetobacter nitrogenifigens DSM 23921 = NBRC 105050 TaxID=1120919 RepID=A0A511XDP0_9PROT|nr:hypothetical protein AA23498_2791 [Acetobacter nitrogenifigens DSM 23921 = NBRC 105050]GEN61058.1 hypothetical protein ANI02nite_29420 [Acetobacter nitrogenifigens DSM 23921 = NBRC 105050]